MQAQKLTFQEAWNSSTVFFVDDELEDEIDEQVAELLAVAQSPYIASAISRTVDDIDEFLGENTRALDVILRDIGLSDEKFMRIISLLRKIGYIPGGFDSEWSMSKVKRSFTVDSHLRKQIADLLFDGKSQTFLIPHIPRYYLEKLNYREIGTLSQAARQVRYKDAAIGTYGAKKGHRVEGEIKKRLDEIQIRYGVGYEKGRSRIINVDIDFAIPTLEDPWVIIMSSFQETTSSGQTTKARDMLNAFMRINESNSRFGENRAFVNFVDGGGWLARKRDLERLVEECHYFVNLNNLDMLESIVTRHVPRKYLAQ